MFFKSNPSSEHFKHYSNLKQHSNLKQVCTINTKKMFENKVKKFPKNKIATKINKTHLLKG
jgi:hypothetical protein